jgi:hypothetical protein
MVMDCRSWLNPAARAFGVSGLTHPLQSMSVPGRRGRGCCDQGVVELAGDVALQAADDLPAGQAFAAAAGGVGAGPFVEP